MNLFSEALKNSPDLLVSESRVQASRYRIPQAKALPDPMFMFGYQNEGFDRFTLGEEQGRTGHVLCFPDVPLSGKTWTEG